MKLAPLVIIPSVFLFVGCGGLVPYQVAVEASHPGARIEANNDYVGVAPVTITVMGDKDGTFHGEGWYVIRAMPEPGATNQNVQIKRFWRGGWFQPEASIPKRIYFDMTLPTEDDSRLNFNNSK
jgi:hypothetical protein